MNKHILTPDSIAAAKALVSRLCENGHVRMSVPVDFARDEDMLICALIEVAEKSLATPTPAASRAATGETASILRFNPIPGLGMNPHPTGLYVYYQDHLAALEAAQPASPAPLTDEQRRAVKEGERIASADTYFRLRHPMLDTRDRRNVFEAAFDRGYDAALASPQVAPKAPADCHSCLGSGDANYLAPEWPEKAIRCDKCGGTGRAAAKPTKPTLSTQGEQSHD